MIEVSVGNLDLKEVMEGFLKEIQNSIDYAYPSNRLAEDRCHAALQTIQGKVKTLSVVLKNVKIDRVKVEPTA